MDYSTTTLMVLKGLNANNLITFSRLQTLLIEHERTLEALWWFLFFITPCVVIGLHIKQRRKGLNDTESNKVN
mgnify:CR=1